MPFSKSKHVILRRAAPERMHLVARRTLARFGSACCVHAIRVKEIPFLNALLGPVESGTVSLVTAVSQTSVSTNISVLFHRCSPTGRIEI